MTANEYQKAAMRTCNLKGTAKEMHALHGMAGEVGEIHSIYQKIFQGHIVSDKDIMKEVGDLLWFVSEYVDAKGWLLNDIMKMNIDKLKLRYPNGFEAERSLNRGKE